MVCIIELVGIVTAPVRNSIYNNRSVWLLRPRPHVSGYFWIRNALFPDTNKLFPRPRVSGFTLALRTHLEILVTEHALRWPSRIQHCSKELGSILWHQWIKKYPDLASTRIQIHSGFKTFHSGEQIQNVANSSAGYIRYVWTIAVPGKKTLRTQKYPDTCWQGLRRKGYRIWPTNAEHKCLILSLKKKKKKNPLIKKSIWPVHAVWNTAQNSLWRRVLPSTFFEEKNKTKQTNKRSTVSQEK